MAWLPHGEKISKISLFVLAQLTKVTDRRTDGRTPDAGNSRAMHSIARQKWMKAFVIAPPHLYTPPLNVTLVEFCY